MVFKSYSLRSGYCEKVVKSVVQEDDGSRNLVIFGLSEEKKETVEECVKEISEVIKLKPPLQAGRVGKTSMDNSKHPLKASISSASTVYQNARYSGKQGNCVSLRSAMFSYDLVVQMRSELLIDS